MTNALLFGIFVMQIIGVCVQCLPRDWEEELKWEERTHELETTNQDILDGKGLKPIRRNDK